MAKASRRPDIEERIAEIGALRAGPDTPEAHAKIEKALGSKRGPLAAAAARLIAEAELTGFEQALEAAFERFMEQPVKRDPGCMAKAAVARALHHLGTSGQAVFLRGIRHVQPEPIWGGTQDTAVELRGICAAGLVRSGYPDAVTELADLLADPEPMARMGAAQAVAYAGHAEVGVPLLRLRALAGEKDSRVLGACFAGLLELAPERCLPFVASFIDHSDDETAEAALLALGESRRPAALPILRTAAEAELRPERQTLAYLAIALMRSDGAWDFLLSVVRDASEARALQAIDALATYRAEPRMRERALAAVAERGDPRLGAHAERAFADVSG
ncbi:MAG: HEAT repeat domain-containing protein [Myxococcales bacterium]|nr:HEAT repeat domain-containing protein [Myxococcales bacterium]